MDCFVFQADLPRPVNGTHLRLHEAPLRSLAVFVTACASWRNGAEISYGRGTWESWCSQMWTLVYIYDFATTFISLPHKNAVGALGCELCTSWHDWIEAPVASAFRANFEPLYAILKIVAHLETQVYDKLYWRFVGQQRGFIYCRFSKFLVHICMVIISNCVKVAAFAAPTCCNPPRFLQKVEW